MSSITLKSKSASRTFDFNEGENLLSVLQRNAVTVSAPCGGNGKCGKCKVNIVRPGGEESVLACKTPAEDNMTVLVGEPEGAAVCDSFEYENSDYGADGAGFGIAVDLGTTTVAAALTELSSGKILRKTSAMNAQSVYGADVISRTQYTIENENGLDILCGTVNAQINRMADELCKDCGIDRAATKLFIAGNTIMQHICASLPPKSIAAAPFTPVTLFAGSDKYSPCVSGYVGGDITAGMLAVGLHNTKELSLFVDLGTNGEMAIGNAEGIVCCSVASGPAFEGADITCGMAGTTGAINHISFSDGEFVFTTIGDAEPRGICGSGIIELTACLLRLGIIDASGYLQPPEEVDDDFGELLGEDEDGNGIVYITKDKSVFFTARDVRRIQLAKAAVAAGIEILMQEIGASPEDVRTIYLVGGFGTYIDVKSAVEIGMLPGGTLEKVKSVGNSSLAGAVLALCSSRAAGELSGIPALCRYVELSGDKRFNDLFADNMAFYEEDF